MSHRILTLAEASDYLHLSESDLNLLVKRDEIPFRQQAGQVVFPRNELDRWASTRLLGMSDDDVHAFHTQSTAKVHDLSARHALIPELMQTAFIEPELEGKTKPKIIHNMVDLADRTGMVWDRDGLLAGVREREELCSTALSGQAALLHPPHHEPYMFEDSFICLGRSRQPILFGAEDGSTTRFFFLICSQEDRIHLHLLARISMICYRSEALAQLAEATDASQMLDILIAAEAEVITHHAPVSPRRSS
jgi:PTS system nitrogen regulatory IIA component